MEFIPGKFEITSNIGQLTIVNVSNFSIIVQHQYEALIDNNQTVTFHCSRPEISFGLTFVHSFNVFVGNLNFLYCSAKSAASVKNEIEILLVRNDFKINHYFWAWIGNLVHCETGTVRFPCLITLMSINSHFVEINQVTIKNSRGVGFLGFRNENLHITHTLMSHNGVNCIIYLSLIMTNITYSNFTDGHQSSNVGLASGLSIFTDAKTIKSSYELNEIHLIGIKFSDNMALCGNIYLQTVSYDGISKMVIKNLTSIIGVQFSLPGIVIEYYINYRYQSYNNIEIENGTFIGGCVNIIGWKKWGFDEDVQFSLRLNKIKILESNCPVAFTANITETLDLIEFEIHNSRGNIAYTCNVLSRIYIVGGQFIDNKGTFVVNSGSVNFENILFFNNIASPKHNSILDVRNSSTISFEGSIYFMKNKGKLGGAISSHNSQLFFGNRGIFSKKDGIFFFIGNKADNGGAISLTNKSTLLLVAEIVFTGNKAQTYGGAIYVDDSVLVTEGFKLNLSKNMADNGGAISLTKGALIQIRRKTDIIISHNTAQYYGGGMFVDDAGLWEGTSQHKCFVQRDNTSVIYTIKFQHNKAEVAGSHLFGGWIDYCYPTKSMQKHLQFEEYVHESDTDLSLVSSNPSRVCLCTNSIPNCSRFGMNVELFPGQTFTVEIVVVGQRFGVVPAIVRAVFRSRNYDIVDDLHKLQEGQKKCSTHEFTIQSPNKKERMLLTVDKRYIPNPMAEINVNNILRENLPLYDLHINISLKHCLFGFLFEPNLNICACHFDLVNKGIECNITTHTVERKSQQWISGNLVKNRIIIHDHCPFDFCNAEHNLLNLSSPNEQCMFSRSGILCGVCQFGQSQVLGSSNCRKCSNIWVLLSLPLALAGIALVIFLTVLNLTVSVGTVNGLIFYANIIRANTATFFPGQSANSFLSWFIAWTNLDLGIETCFYNGLNAYTKTWLQFLFPLYVWLMMAVIIVSSHYSSRAGRIFGNNAVQVLATLFLLSYAKLLRVTITIFQPARLVIQELFNMLVWRYDGNIVYLQGKHILLFVVALLFLIFLFAPYTLILFGIQWLQPLSHYKLFFWVNKFKPLLDAYTGPYKDKHRYWTGLLLLVRIVLFIVFSANTAGNAAIDLLAVTLTIISLFVYTSIFGGPYKLWLLGLLEHTYLMNLAFLCIGSLYLLTSGMQIYTLSQVSVSITLITMMFTVIYHCSVVMIKKTKNLKLRSLSAMLGRLSFKSINNDTINAELNMECTEVPQSKVTYTLVKLDECDNCSN